MLAAEKHKGTYLAPVGIGLSLFVAELAGVFYTGGTSNPAVYTVTRLITTIQALSTQLVPSVQPSPLPASHMNIGSTGSAQRSVHLLPLASTASSKSSNTRPPTPAPISTRKKQRSSRSTKIMPRAPKMLLGPTLLPPVRYWRLQYRVRRLLIIINNF